MTISIKEQYSEIIKDSTFLEVYDSGSQLEAARLSESFTGLISDISSVSPEKQLAEVTTILDEIGGDARRIAGIIRDSKADLDRLPARAKTQFELEMSLFSRATGGEQCFVGDHVRANSVVRAFFSIPGQGRDICTEAFTELRRAIIKQVDWNISFAGGGAEFIKIKVGELFSSKGKPGGIISAKDMLESISNPHDYILLNLLDLYSVSDVIGLCGPENTVLLDFCTHHEIQTDRINFKTFRVEVAKIMNIETSEREVADKKNEEELNKKRRKFYEMKARRSASENITWTRTGTLEKVLNFLRGL